MRMIRSENVYCATISASLAIAEIVKTRIAPDLTISRRNDRLIIGIRRKSRRMNRMTARLSIFGLWAILSMVWRIADIIGYDFRRRFTPRIFARYDRAKKYKIVPKTITIVFREKIN